MAEGGVGVLPRVVREESESERCGHISPLSRTPEAMVTTAVADEICFWLKSAAGVLLDAEIRSVDVSFTFFFFRLHRVLDLARFFVPFISGEAVADDDEAAGVSPASSGLLESDCGLEYSMSVAV